MKATLDALELGAVRELDATDAVKAVGWASPQDFVTCVAGGHKGAVRLLAIVDPEGDERRAERAPRPSSRP